MSEQQDRTAVRTYVPEHQRAVWAREADSMDMSLSEFVRSMVQAGRRDFELEGSSSSDQGGIEEHHPGGSTPRGRALEDRVLATLESAGVAGWDDLVAALSDDFEERLEDVLDELQDRNEIRYAPRDGGYVRTEAE